MGRGLLPLTEEEGIAVYITWDLADTESNTLYYDIVYWNRLGQFVAPKRNYRIARIQMGHCVDFGVV